MNPTVRNALLWTIPCAVLLADQASKLYAENVHLLAPPRPTMADHRATFEVLFALGSESANFFSFKVTHVANAGLMLGALEESPQPIPWLAFLGATVLALAVAFWLFRTASPGFFMRRLGAIILATGVIGNLIDKLRLGYVIDWAHWQWHILGWGYDAPAFNVADLAIIAGAVVAGVSLLNAHRSTIRARIRRRGISA